MHRVYTGYLVLVAVMVAVPFLAIQDNLEASSEGELFVQDGLVYEIDEYFRTADVVGPEEGWDRAELEVPSGVIHDDKEYRVTGIGPQAFENMTSLESASLPETVSDIGTRAFAGCTSLADINIPHAVTSLRETFIGCTSLESVMLTGSYYVTELHGTFEGCISLKDVAIRWTAVVGDRTFAGCESLTNLDFGNIHSVGDGAFGSRGGFGFGYVGRGAKSIARYNPQTGERIFIKKNFPKTNQCQ